MPIPRAGSLKFTLQQERFLHPEKEITKDYQAVYKKTVSLSVGPTGRKSIS